MTGWRLGWMLVPPDLARSVEMAFAQNFYISPPALSQIAALPVFAAAARNSTAMSPAIAPIAIC